MVPVLLDREAHSADGQTYIVQSRSHHWDVVLGGVRQMSFMTREAARTAIRVLKARAKTAESIVWDSIAVQGLAEIPPEPEEQERWKLLMNGGWPLEEADDQ